MDKQFYRIYSELGEVYRATQAGGMRAPFVPGIFIDNASLRSLAIVTEAIEQAMSKLEGRYSLRPDARLFLMVNLHQLVALPLSQRDSPVEMNAEIEAGIKQDAIRIIEMAAESAGYRNDIPASHIMWGTAKILDELNLKSWRIWDRD